MIHWQFVEETKENSDHEYIFQDFMDDVNFIITKHSKIGKDRGKRTENKELIENYVPSESCICYPGENFRCKESFQNFAA